MDDLENFEDATRQWGNESSEKISAKFLQLEPTDCHISCQKNVLETFGIEMSHEELIEKATQEGWYNPESGGTSLDDFGKLLESEGINITREANGDIYNLVDHLSQGHQIIVGVKTESYHSVLVTGIDTSDPQNIQVVIRDPATGELDKSLEFDEFIEEWNGADSVMVSTNTPPPPQLNMPEMENFDYEEGHIENIGSISYDEFSEDIMPKIRELKRQNVENWQDLNESFADLTSGEITMEDFLEDIHEIEKTVKSTNYPGNNFENNEEEEDDETPLTQNDPIQEEEEEEDDDDDD